VGAAVSAAAGGEAAALGFGGGFGGFVSLGVRQDTGLAG